MDSKGLIMINTELSELNKSIALYGAEFKHNTNTNVLTLIVDTEYMVIYSVPFNHLVLSYLYNNRNSIETILYFMISEVYEDTFARRQANNILEWMYGNKKKNEYEQLNNVLNAIYNTKKVVKI